MQSIRSSIHRDARARGTVEEGVALAGGEIDQVRDPIQRPRRTRLAIEAEAPFRSRNLAIESVNVGQTFARRFGNLVEQFFVLPALQAAGS
jgi:hypothetical protein